MKICSQCGAQNDDVAFCKQCGAMLADPAPVADVTPSEPDAEIKAAENKAESVKEATPATDKTQKNKLGINAILSVAGLGCVLLQSFISIVISIVINVINRSMVDGVAVASWVTTVIVLIFNILQYLLLIAGAGTSIAGAVMTFTNKKLCAETKLYCKVFAIAVAVLCVCLLLLTAIGSIASAIIW